MKLIDQIAFKLTGKKVPVYRVSEVDQESGLILSLQDMGYCKDDPNGIFYPWENKDYEKRKDTKPVTRVNTNGIAEPCWIVSERGQTVNLYTQPWKGPQLESVLGQMVSVDSIAKAMGLEPSMRAKIVFMVLGIFMGWWVVGPMFSTILS